MKGLDVYVVAQGSLILGLAGVLWPDKVRPLFEVLMFPWAATDRMVRANSIAAIALSVLLAVRLLAG